MDAEERTLADADAELHRRLVYGEESALAEAYAAYGALVRRVAGRVTRSPGAAEDVAQEVFAQLWSRPYAFDPRRGTLRTWLSLLAHRRAVDYAEPVRAELALGPVDFCLLIGGRYAPDAVPHEASGDEGTVRDVLERAASLAWL